MSVGTNIRGTRIAKKMSLKDLSIKSTISLTSLHYIESGENSPTVKTLEKIAAALGVSASDLLDAQPRAVGE